MSSIYNYLRTILLRLLSPPPKKKYWVRSYPVHEYGTKCRIQFRSETHFHNYVSPRIIVFESFPQNNFFFKHIPSPVREAATTRRVTIINRTRQTPLSKHAKSWQPYSNSSRSARAIRSVEDATRVIDTVATRRSVGTTAAHTDGRQTLCK